MKELIQAILNYLKLKKVGEHAEGKDNFFVKIRKSLFDRVKWKAEWTIKKWNGDPVGDPFEEVHIMQNLLLNAGINLLTTLFCGGSGTAYNNANARLGVGDSATAAAATQTALLGSNTLWKAMDSGFPTYGTSQLMTFKSTFGSSEANFAWNEFAVGNAAGGGTLANRKVSAQGTKVSGQTWELTLTITLL
jgi:hypothetical protein